MLGMRAFGIMQVAKIKKHFLMFSSIDLAAITRRCHTLLGCSSIKMINESRISCDPFLIRAYYLDIMAKRRTDQSLAKRFKVKNGKVVHSYPRTQAKKASESALIKREFTSD